MYFHVCCVLCDIKTKNKEFVLLIAYKSMLPFHFGYIFLYVTMSLSILPFPLCYHIIFGISPRLQKNHHQVNHHQVPLKTRASLGNVNILKNKWTRPKKSQLVPSLTSHPLRSMVPPSGRAHSLTGWGSMCQRVCFT